MSVDRRTGSDCPLRSRLLRLCGTSWVRLPASELLVSAWPLACDAWPGGAARPLGTGERWTAWHATRRPGASCDTNELGHFVWAAERCSAQESRLVGGVGLRRVAGMPFAVRPDPSILGVVGVGGSRRESCLHLVPGRKPRRSCGRATRAGLVGPGPGIPRPQLGRARSARHAARGRRVGLGGG
jgi:hypothetical protein